MRNLDESQGRQERLVSRELTRRVIENLPRDKEGAYEPEDAAIELARISSAYVSEEQLRLDHARKQIAALRRPHAFQPDYQLTLPGMEPYAISTMRHVLGPEGKMIENYRANFRYKQAEANRTMDHATAAMIEAQRRQKEAAEMSVWSIAKITEGENPEQLTFKRFLAETNSGRPLAGEDEVAA